MPDHEADTVAIPALGRSGERLPAAPEHPRDHLPGLETDRRINDWGRSERIEALFDRSIYDFLFRYWFRVEVDGIENVPGDGGALLVANHSGTHPHDGPMIAKAIAAEHPQPRPVHFVTDRRLRRLPGIGMLTTKLGAIPDHPSDVKRLLGDERELVLAFPEGRTGPRKPVSLRYRLREFSEGAWIRTAVDAGVPIVPVAVLGAEEAAPVIARLRFPRGRSFSLGPAAPLPAKFRIRFLEPVDSEAAPAEHSAAIRALIQENLLEMVGQRRSVWLG
jgi:1-acyl-sn-glycerol-3-phosphate acyltransferase